VLGTRDGRYLRHDGPEHVLAVGPTRSGKGVGLVVPTLMTWPGSAVIHDIKGEIWQLTAGWRTRFSHCLLLDPSSPVSARFNPLLKVRILGGWPHRSGVPSFRLPPCLCGGAELVGHSWPPTNSLPLL
jgi:type IV secretory pathway TraG/TraD family ATPase VirD4